MIIFIEERRDTYEEEMLADCTSVNTLKDERIVWEVHKYFAIG